MIRDSGKRIGKKKVWLNQEELGRWGMSQDRIPRRMLQSRVEEDGMEWKKTAEGKMEVEKE